MPQDSVLYQPQLPDLGQKPHVVSGNFFTSPISHATFYMPFVTSKMSIKYEQMIFTSTFDQFPKGMVSINLNCDNKLSLGIEYSSTETCWITRLFLEGILFEQLTS